MTRVTFKATGAFTSYHDLPLDWKDGETRDIEDGRAADLVADFPNNFIPEMKATQKPPETKEVKRPAKNK